MKETGSFGGLAAGFDLGALGDGVGDVFFDLLDGGLVDEGALSGGAVETAADLEGGDLLNELGSEGLGDSLLDVESVGAVILSVRDCQAECLGGNIPDASLSRASELAEHSALNSKIEIGIIKNDERSIATKLQADLLKGTGSKLRQHLTNTSRPSEGDLLHLRVSRQLSSSLAITRRENLDSSRRKASLDSELDEGGARVGGLGGGLDDDGAAGCEGGGDLAGDHGRGEVPGRDDAADADGLADCHESGVGSGRWDRDAVGSGGLFGEPGDEVGGVDDLASGLREGLSILQGQDNSNYDHLASKTLN